MKNPSKHDQAKGNNKDSKTADATAQNSGFKKRFDRPAFAENSESKTQGDKMPKNISSGSNSTGKGTSTSTSTSTQDDKRRIVSQRPLSNIVTVDRAVEKVVELPVDRIVEVEKEVEKAVEVIVEKAVSYTHLTLPTIYSV